MEKYNEMKNKHQKEVNAFPMGFAFSNKQFKEAKEKLGVKDNSELLSIYGGGFIRKKDREAYEELFTRIDKETEEAMKKPEFAYSAFRYELSNHEYVYTHDKISVLSCLGLSTEHLENSEMLQKEFEKAVNDYLENVEA
jgi:aspartyl-tRNA synthetase